MDLDGLCEAHDVVVVFVCGLAEEMAEVSLDGGGLVEFDGGDGQRQGHLQLAPFVEHKLHHHPRDVDAVVKGLAYVVEQGRLDEYERNPVNKSIEHVQIEEILLLLHDKLQFFELVLHDFCVELQPGQLQVVQIRGDLSALVLEQLLVEFAAHPDEPVEVHHAFQHDAVESKLGEFLGCLAYAVLERGHHPVDLDLDAHLLEQLHSLHRTQLLPLHKQFLH